MKKLTDFYIPQKLADFAEKHNFHLVTAISNNYLILNELPWTVNVYLYLKDEGDSVLDEKSVFEWSNRFPKSLEEAFDMWLAMQNPIKDNPTKDDYVAFELMNQDDYDKYIAMMDGRNNE